MKDCYSCKHRRRVPGDAHSSCACHTAEVVGNPRGIKGGWFHWPFNFDPTWVVACDSYEEKKMKEKLQKSDHGAEYLFIEAVRKPLSRTTFYYFLCTDSNGEEEMVQVDPGELEGKDGKEFAKEMMKRSLTQKYLDNGWMMIQKNGENKKPGFIQILKEVKDD